MDQAENLRKIMQQKEEQAKEAARVIAVTSGKGGVGKWTHRCRKELRT